MPGPASAHRPVFSREFLTKCREVARCRATSFGEVQWAKLVLLLHDQSSISNVAAGLELDLHPIRSGCGDGGGHRVINRSKTKKGVGASPFFFPLVTEPSLKRLRAKQ